MSIFIVSSKSSVPLLDVVISIPIGGTFLLMMIILVLIFVILYKRRRTSNDGVCHKHNKESSAASIQATSFAVYEDFPEDENQHVYESVSDKGVVLKLNSSYVDTCDPSGNSVQVHTNSSYELDELKVYDTAKPNPCYDGPNFAPTDDSKRVEETERKYLVSSRCVLSNSESLV